ncbi:metal ABC transporter permease [Marinivivus vitaminiproducens]|uniref:metal ABC transporter permease n=1 Tax=Marinivivus vitaminiproducens TaxID=3035935 RepID=UPI0027A16B19|nr:hypothetical protein P4R82_16030 [Geminicoccaceae bacterium SCSIO 64248]
MPSSARSVALASAALAALVLTSATGMAAERLRGRIATVEGDAVTIEARDGTRATVTLTDATRYARIVPAELSDVTAGSFIGTATKEGPDGPVALEVLIFPESMRGMGEGHYAWDPLPDTTLATGGDEVTTSMTGGTVDATTGMPEVESMMTNGTVDTHGGQGETQTLNVTYQGGSQTVTVPPTAPIVTIEPGDRSLVEENANAFVVAEPDADSLQARVVSIGADGLVPPM